MESYQRTFEEQEISAGNRSIYELGYDAVGRRIVINEKGKYVTHIPGHLSEDEVLKRLHHGEIILFDARNQGMQNNPKTWVDEFEPVKVASPEESKVFEAWHRLWLVSWTDKTKINLDEFRELYLSNPQEAENLIASCQP